MKKIILLLISSLLTILSFGQERKDLTVSFSVGKLTSPHYSDAKAREYYNVDFDYYLTTRHLLSANFNSGKHWYNDNVLSNVPIHENMWNAKAYYSTFSILYKYKFLNRKSFSADIGAGAGIMTHIRDYQFSEPNRGDVKTSVWTDLTFPVRLDLDYKLSPHFKLGLIGGFFIHPDFPILAYHVGPRLTYVVK